MEEELENQINKSLVTFLEKENNLLYFLLNRTYRETLAKEAYYNEEIREILIRQNPSLIENFKNSEDKLSSAKKSQLDFYNELTYKTYYQYFEEYISELFVILYKNLPKFLRKEIIEISHKDLFEGEDIAILRSKLIERKVNVFIQSNNIKTILQRFKKLFGVDLEIDNEELNELYRSSKIRNILTHNSNIINQAYLDDLNKENIKSSYKIGDKVNLEEELKIIQELISPISSRMAKKLIKKNLQMIQYHSKL